ncbi:NADPH-dependent F420 reductase [Streptomyces sp. NBC_01477]|uniref:NADPH-dependent F420 reductase n=1 Tax=Streptomyces sp. NBC_01477 TaxID=2976015 RepID=UPI002E338574|nr:NAD(P)-binding domain-containing protein [Streptomyces sp. NBC_01477]
MTTIAILGAGRVGGSLARKLASAGHDVVVGRRHPGEEAGDPSVRVTDQRTAAREAGIVINATPGDTSLDRLSDLRAELAGTILVDVSNATRDAADGLPGDLVYPDGSLAERLQRALPETRVVKTLNTMLFTVMTDPRSLSTPPTAYLSGDDDTAKDEVKGLLADLGWRPEWIEDLGDVSTARAAEALVLLVPHILRRRGFHPFAVSLAR